MHALGAFFAIAAAVVTASLALLGQRFHVKSGAANESANRFTDGSDGTDAEPRLPLGGRRLRKLHPILGGIIFHLLICAVTDGTDIEPWLPLGGRRLRKIHLIFHAFICAVTIFLILAFVVVCELLEPHGGVVVFMLRCKRGSVTDGIGPDHFIDWGEIWAVCVFVGVESEVSVLCHQGVERYIIDDNSKAISVYQSLEVFLADVRDCLGIIVEKCLNIGVFTEDLGEIAGRPTFFGNFAALDRSCAIAVSGDWF